MHRLIFGLKYLWAPDLERIAIFRGDISRIPPEPEFLSSCKQNRFAPQLCCVSFRGIETRIFFELQRVDRKWVRSERVLDLSEKLIIRFKGWPISPRTRDSSRNNSLYFVIKWLIKSIFKKMPSLLFTKIKIYREYYSQYYFKVIHRKY